MKRAAAERNFRKLKNQVNQISEIVRHTKVNALWEHEASLRKKIKELNEYKQFELKDFNKVYEDYLEIYNYISEKLIKDYNNRNNTSFDFYEVVRKNFDTYLKSGIISVLITEHIPKMISEEFQRVFPKNPKDEYTDARKIERKFYLHLGDTNTGKTYTAMEKLKASSKGIYLSPLRILALENYEKLNREEVKCNLLTGEEEIFIEGAKHTSCTIEKLDINEYYDCAVVDEIQMIGDSQRGQAWTRALLGIKAKEIHLCGALNTKKLLVKILEDCNEEYVLKEYKRDIPLLIQEESFHIKKAEPGDALVVFSKKRVLELAKIYSEMGIRCSIIYGDLPPEVRKKQYEQFVQKESNILISTDAIGMGVNLPIKRIVFMDIKKFDGNEVRFLTSQEVKQIGGRAGRKGVYDQGYVSCSGNNQEFLRENLESEDDNIAKAVLGPSEAILKIGNLSLREKIALWSTEKEKVSFYRKMDVTDYLIILDAIKKYKLDDNIQWKLMRLPIDVKEAEVIDCLLSYIDEIFVAKRESLSKPNIKYEYLGELEKYYQKINLYYSFSKNFALPFDEQWIYDERIRIGEKINSILVNLQD